MEPGEGQVQADFAGHAYPPSFPGELFSPGCAIHPGEMEAPHAFLGEPLQGPVIICLILEGGILTMVHHHQDQETIQGIQRVPGQALQGFEQVFSFGKGRDHHGTVKNPLFLSLDPPRMKQAPGIQIFLYLRGDH
ncbi:MAG: hypothetical protein NTY64_13345 [Deltaproteobacteria bacterium]|nr:hypothetical protein [Deltaproteobacteria bacterium]